MHAMLSDGADVGLLLACIIFVYWQPTVTSWKRQTAYYDRHRNLIPWAPPPVVFMLVWPVLYILVALSYYFYFSSQTDANKYYIAQFVLFVVGIMMGKFWTPVFFYMHQFWFALLFCFVMIGTGVGSLVMFAIDSSDQWLSFGLLMPYVVWVTFGAMLNYYWAVAADAGMIEHIRRGEGQFDEYEPEYEQTARNSVRQ